MGIKESMEVLDFIEGVASDLAAHKADDGEISKAEYVRTAIANGPAAVRAAAGADKIFLEVKDLDAEEAKALAAKAMDVYASVLKLFA